MSHNQPSSITDSLDDLMDNLSFRARNEILHKLNPSQNSPAIILTSKPSRPPLKAWKLFLAVLLAIPGTMIFLTLTTLSLGLLLPLAFALAYPFFKPIIRLLTYTNPTSDSQTLIHPVDL